MHFGHSLHVFEFNTLLHLLKLLLIVDAEEGSHGQTSRRKQIVKILLVNHILCDFDQSRVEISSPCGISSSANILIIWTPCSTQC